MKIIGQLSLNPMVMAHFRGRQIFKFTEVFILNFGGSSPSVGLLRRKGNKKSAAADGLCSSDAAEVVFFRPTILIQNRSAQFEKNPELNNLM